MFTRTWKRFPASALACLLVGLVAGPLVHNFVRPVRGDPAATTIVPQRPRLAVESAAAFDPNWQKSYLQAQPVGKDLQPCPDLKPGDLPPQDLSIFGGAGKTSFSSVDDVKDFDEFYR